MKRLVLALCVAVLGCAEQPTTAPAPPDPQRLPEGFAYPNGIAAAPDGTLYVGSITAGTILRLRPGRTPDVLLDGDPGVFAGTALELDSGSHRLWVSSPDFLGGTGAGRIAVVDVDDGRVEWSTPVPEGAFLNDIALDGVGGAYFTDSALGRIWHVDGPTQAFEVFASDSLLEGPGIGPAGIVRTPEGELIVGLYDVGRFVRVTADGAVEDLPIAGEVHNPDGLELTDDGRLLVVEGDVDGGDGRLSSIDLLAPAPHPVQVLESGLDTPTNLARVGDEVVVTESKVRHRMRPALDLPPPTRWRLPHFALPPADRTTVAIATLPGDFFPESIARDDQGRFYLGSASRSEVVRVAPDGSEVWLSAEDGGLMSVQGLLVVRDVLYVCTGDLGKHRTPTVSASLSAYDLGTAKLRHRWLLPDGFCNDLALTPEERIVITDTMGSRLWSVVPDTPEAAVLLEDPRLGGVNGLALTPEGTEAFVSTFPDGRLLRVGLTPPMTVAEIPLPRPLDGGDALRLLEDGRLLVFENGLPHGTGRVSILDLAGQQSTLVPLLETSVSPTSGVVVGDHVVWAASNFGQLFGGVRSHYDRRLYQTALKRPARPR